MGQALASRLALKVACQLRRISCVAGLFILIAAFGCLSIGFASMAMFVAVRDAYGSVAGCLSVSALYCVLSLLAWLFSCQLQRRTQSSGEGIAGHAADPALASGQGPSPRLLPELDEALSILGGIPTSGSMVERMALAAICGLLVGRKLGRKSS